MILKNNGFTLIETIIAISILTVGVLGSYYVFSNLYVNSGGSFNKLIASYLSQEGIEIMRNLRDENWIKNNNNWINGIFDENNCSSSCSFQADYRTGVDNLSFDLIPFPSGGNFLNVNNNGLYLYDANYPNSIFKRKISIFPISEERFKIESEVFWDYAGKNFSIKIEEFLYNWY